MDHDNDLYNSKLLQTSKLFNSTLKDKFSGMAIIGRDIGIQNYEIPFEQQEI